MHPAPSIIKLRQGIAHQQLNKAEEINCLAEDDQVVNFVQDIVADVNRVQAQDDPAQDETDESQPLRHPLIVGVVLLCTVDAVGQCEAEGCSEFVYCVLKGNCHCVFVCVAHRVKLPLLQSENLLCLHQKPLVYAALMQ